MSTLTRDVYYVTEDGEMKRIDKFSKEELLDIIREVSFELFRLRETHAHDLRMLVPHSSDTPIS